MMKICEIRDLDGPNIFLRQPAIKLEVSTDDGNIHVSRAAQSFTAGEVAEPGGGVVAVGGDRLLVLVAEVVNVLHDRTGEPRPEIASRAMEEQGHFAAAFSWSHRRYAEALGRLALDIVINPATEIEAGIVRLQDILQSAPESDDAPGMVRNADRRIPSIAVTGTNGKTTTARLISFVLRHAGQRVGMTSSAGVYIDLEQVLSGDYSGPSGARRVFEDEHVDVAVLETARGGILLRGLGYEESDVSVVTNVSADHMGLHGVHSVEELAQVKRVVPRTTRESGFAVLNADDPLVLAMREGLRARPFLVTRTDGVPQVSSHIEAGGWALTVDDGQIQWWHDGDLEVLTTLNEVPMTFGGMAPHMVENALCAAAACLAIGMDVDKVRSGLAAFRSSSRDNHGRLNVYAFNGATIVLDFAHNDEGLRHLLAFSRHFLQGEGELTAVVGTAGDRDDAMFGKIGRIAAEQADRLILKDTTRYLRGREPGEMVNLMQAGADAVPGREPAVDHAPSEREACTTAFATASPGDVVAVMCIEDYDFLLDYLDEHGTPIS